MRIRTIAMILAVSYAPSFAEDKGGSNWPQFRGPGGLGIAASGQPLPIEFNQSRNTLWRCAVSKGHSSPCVWGDRIFLTGSVDDKLETVCIDRTSGKVLWRRRAPATKIERVHRVNSPATPTPTTDGERVFVFFGSYGLLCYDFDGALQWKRPLTATGNTFGTGGSPIIAGDYLIFSCDQNRDSYLEVIDRKSGQTVWKTDRSQFKANWSTPMYWNNDGVDELVVYGIWWLTAYDLKDGSERWSVPGLADEPAITPVTGRGLVYVTSYNMKTSPEAIGLPKFADLVRDFDKDKDGQLTREEIKDNKSILSRYDADGEGDHPLPGFFRFLDADKDGKLTKTEWGRIVKWVGGFKHENALLAIRPGAGGPYYASPVVGDGKIYASSARGVVTVFEAGDTLEILAKNDLKERIMATPAIVDGTLYVRTEEALYAFGANSGPRGE